MSMQAMADDIAALVQYLDLTTHYDIFLSPLLAQFAVPFLDES